MERGIFAELTTGPILMCMTGIGNTLNDSKRLILALKEISECSGAAAPSPAKSSVTAVLKEKLRLFPVPQDKERIPLLEGAGRICASSIIPYPPGIPFICPGEELTEEVIMYIKRLRDAGEKVIGINDQGEITVGRQVR
jgi:lysine decarboxylase